MKVKEDKTYPVGVIVGRFQVPELHEAHKDLIQTVMDRHDRVIVILGLSQLRVTRNNPLDYESRKKMLMECFPTITVKGVKDCKEDTRWSKQLDKTIVECLPPKTDAVLYGSRSSFLPHYSGKFDTKELIQDRFISGTEVRRAVSLHAKGTEDFRAGVCWATANQYEKVWATVDVAIFDETMTKILLGRKPYEQKFRFVGGFADPASPSYEADVRREVMEEAGIDITDPKYIGSKIVDDWRYRSEQDKIKTLFFYAKYFSGKVIPNDDICELKWVEFSLGDEKRIKAIKDNLVDEHVFLLDMLLKQLNK